MELAESALAEKKVMRELSWDRKPVVCVRADSSLASDFPRLAQRCQKPGQYVPTLESDNRPEPPLSRGKAKAMCAQLRKWDRSGSSNERIACRDDFSMASDTSPLRLLN